VVAAILTLPFVWHAAPDPKTAADRADFYWQWILPLVIANWIIADARERRRQLCYDHDTFQFWAWPLLGPVYLVRTRGWRAAWPILAFAFLWSAALIETLLLAALVPK
jgi:hypothetical protein